jgi:nucleotide-binding universal stress UspA family protein
MFNRILVPLDGSRLAECVLPHAVTLAQAFDARLTFVQVVERISGSGLSRTIDPLRWQIRKTEAQAYLNEVSARIQATGLETEEHVLEGQAAERIVEFAHNQDVDLILLSSHGRSGLSRWNISSVGQKVIWEAHMPMMIVRAYRSVPDGTAQASYARILAPLDGSQRAECVLPFANQLACSQEAELLLAHVVGRPEVPSHTPLAREEIELIDRLTEYNRLEVTGYLKELAARLQCDVQPRLLSSEDTAAALHELVDQENVDLVALSAHGYTSGTKWPYGSMALNFIAYGSTPLLIVQDLSPDELEKTQAEISVGESKGH